MELTTLVLYDVEDDRARTRVSDACRDFGLQRLQYSCFCGRLSRNKREELQERLLEIQRGWERRWRSEFPDVPARAMREPYPPEDAARDAWRPVFKILIQPLCDRDLRLALYAYLYVDAPEPEKEREADGVKKRESFARSRMGNARTSGLSVACE